MKIFPFPDLPKSTTPTTTSSTPTTTTSQPEDKLDNKSTTKDADNNKPANDSPTSPDRTTSQSTTPAEPLQENGLKTSSSSTTLDQSTVSIATSCRSSNEDIPYKRLAPICTISETSLNFE